MRHSNFPDSVCDITDKDFWSSLRVPGKSPDAALLRKAVAAGKAGQTKAAYQHLASYHRESLKPLWEHRRSAMEQLNAPDPEAVDALLHNRVKGWHTTVVDFGDRIDWGTTAFGQSGQYGFHYLSWLSPVIQTVTLDRSPAARKWLTSTLDGYYAARNDFDWLIQHMSPVYYELGSGAKSHTILNSYLALLFTGEVSSTTVEALNKLLLGFARSLLRLQKSGYRSGNWQINGCSAMTALACTFPEYREAAKWRSRGLELLRDHVRQDFFADGGHKERCWGYGSGCIRHLAEAHDAIERAGGSAADLRVLRRGLRKAYQWFAATLGPGGLMPAFGDDQLSFDPDFLRRGIRFFPKGTDASLGVDRDGSHLLKPSGFAIMRSGGEDGVYANLSFGQFMGWHSHNDLLSMNVAAFGVPLIEEVGRWEGYDNPLTRLFRIPESHNVVTVDGQSFDSSSTEHRVGRQVYWLSNEHVDVFAAEHTAYRAASSEPQSINAVVRRMVIFVKDPGYFVVHDVVTNEHTPTVNYALTSHWHSPFAFKVKDGRTAVVKHGKVGCVVQYADQPCLRRLEAGADFAGEEATATSKHPERHHLRARRWMPIGHEGGVGFTTLLFPFLGTAPNVSMTTMDAVDGSQVFITEGIAVTTPRGVDRLVLNPGRRKAVRFDGQPIAGRGLIRLAGRRGVIAMD